MHDQGLPFHLWAEACNTTIFLQKHSPYRILGMSTLEEDFSGKKLDVSYFKIFGSSVYVHVTKDIRKKLEPIAKIGIFVGYTNTPHNYRVYFPNRWLTVVRQDTKFHEEKAMRLSRERELDLHVDEELLVPKDEPQDVEQPHAEDHGVKENTHVEPSTRNGRRRTMKADRLRLDATEHLGAPTSLRR